MKKFIAILMCLLMIFSLAACGGETTTPSQPVAETSEKVETQDAVPAEVQAYIDALGFDPRDGEKMTLTFTGSTWDGHPLVDCMKFFAERLDVATGGRITAEVYGNGTLGTARELCEQIKSGMIDAHADATTMLSAYSPECGLLDLPYLFNDLDHARNVMSSEIYDELMATLDGTGIRSLTWLDLGFRNMTNSVRPIKTPEDCKGLKMRALSNPINVDLFNTVGALGMEMAWGEVYLGCQQGTIDGEDNPFFVIESASLDEVQPYMSATEHTYSGAIIMWSEQKWNQLSANDQKLMEYIGKEEVLPFELNMCDTMALNAIENMRAKGHTEIITDIDKAPFAALMKEIYPKYVDTDFKKDIVDRIENFSYGKFTY